MDMPSNDALISLDPNSATEANFQLKIENDP